MRQNFQLYLAPSHDSAADGRLSSQLPAEIPTRHGAFRLSRQILSHGPGAGVEVLTVRGNRTEFTLLPTRGLSLWKARRDDTVFGWDSPVRGPIHPHLVPVDRPDGLGWLSGFDELLVRCGLESNGAPEFDDQHRLRYPLHGRIGNLPAESLNVRVDETAGTIAISGVVREASLFLTNWTLTSTVVAHVDGDVIEITDQVTNHADTIRTHQLLYHINCGEPVLGEGARLIAPALEVVPKTRRAVEGLSTYEIYGAPEVGFAEQVYLMKLQENSKGWSQALLRSADGERGLGVRFDTSTLPYFIQWKNTAGRRDGYVTGLEPSTNFPNTRSFEQSHGRVVEVGPGESITYQLQLCLLTETESVTRFAEETTGLMVQQPRIATAPRFEWCE